MPRLLSASRRKVGNRFAIVAVVGVEISESENDSQFVAAVGVEISEVGKGFGSLAQS